MSRISAECRVRSAEYGNCPSVMPSVSPRFALCTLRSRGFTLIEVLLALAIFSGVVTVIYGVFSTTGSTVEQAEKIRDDTDAARTLISRIQNDIANAYLWDTANPGMSGAKTFFYGRKAEETEQDQKRRFDSLFLTTLTNWRRPDSKEMDLWEVAYYFQDKPDGKGRVLVRKEKRELSPDLPPLEGGVEYEITDQVENLRYRYTSDGSTWVDEWDTGKQGGLPKAVEILLVMSGERMYASSVDIRNSR